MGNGERRGTGRFIKAFLWALAITLLCCWPLFVFSVHIPTLIRSLFGFLLMPGAVMALMVANDTHQYLRWVIAWANLVIYTALIYAILGFRRRRR